MRASARVVEVLCYKGKSGASRVSTMGRVRIRHLVLSAWALVALVCSAAAQPDPREMSGIPLPVSDLPVGAVSVRVIRGQLSNNIPDQPVELHQGDNVLTAFTDESGRAQFGGLSPGTPVFAVTTVDGERLESRRFPVPGQGGVRLVLAAAVSGEGTTAEAEARPGTVTLGGESRLLIELGEENVEVYYLLDVVNAADVPVMPPSPLVVEMPPGAQAITVLPESTPRATADGPQVTVTGPFQPGRTSVSTAYILPYAGGNLEISQLLPAALEEVLIIAETTGEMELVSPQIARYGEITQPGGQTYILGAGSGIPAGGTLTFELAGLPHHSTGPRRIALVLAVLIIGCGVWATVTSGDSVSAGRHQTLQGRREQLFRDLVRLERQHRSGTIDPTRYATRRQELVTRLDQVYGKLDEELAPVVFSSHRPVRSESSVAGHSRTAG